MRRLILNPLSALKFLKSISDRPWWIFNKSGENPITMTNGLSISYPSCSVLLCFPRPTPFLYSRSNDVHILDHPRQMYKVCARVSGKVWSKTLSIMCSPTGDPKLEKNGRSGGIFPPENKMLYKSELIFKQNHLRLSSVTVLQFTPRLEDGRVS